MLKVAASEIDTTAALDLLGADSLTAIGVTASLAGWLDRDLPATLMWDYASIDAIAGGLADSDSPAQVVARHRVVSLQPLGRGLPVFFLPGLGGHPVTFAPMAGHLGLSQPCYGLTVPGLNGEAEPLLSVEEIAAAMLQSARLIQPVGPYQLAGYSFGGLLAYEMAQQLMNVGETVSMLAIFDAFTPAGRIPRPRWQRLGLHAKRLMTKPGRMKYFRDRLLSRHGAAKRAIAQSEADAGSAGTSKEAQVSEVVRLNECAAFRYVPKPYPGQVLLFRALELPDYNVFYKIDPFHGWDALAAGGVCVIDVPGNHLDLLNATHAPAAADALRPYLT
jgi:thioesterase domain-containing protein/acyl carrier protein